jgi:enoyl-CoA hydratase
MTTSEREPVLLRERVGDVELLTLNRPGRRNALSRELMDALGSACRELAHDDSVRVVVFAGSGVSFCAGLDLKELGDSGTNLDGQFIRDIRSMPHPTIAAVDGPAVTAGIEIVLACDIRIGSRRARFADTHARVGVPPGGGATVVLRHVVGLGRALEMSMSGRYVDAVEANDWGLLNRVVDDDPVAPALELAGEIAQNPPELVRHIRTLIHGGCGRPINDALAVESDGFTTMTRGFDIATVRERRDRVFERGRSQVQL